MVRRRCEQEHALSGLLTAKVLLTNEQPKLLPRKISASDNLRQAQRHAQVAAASTGMQCIADSQRTRRGWCFYAFPKQY
jgi:hypothetical protein